ncbi:MAG TPA: sigma-70 family RNA polymerase sigma factor [Acidimicrobiales bacterium]
MADEGAWARSLGRALDAGDSTAARRVLAEVPAVRAERDAGLDLLAHRAAAGSLLAADLLASAVDGLGLARAGVRRVLVGEADVDDVTQDTLVSMAASLGSFTGEASFVTWLFTIAKHRAVDHLRRRRAGEPLGDDVGEAVRISSLVATRETVRAMVERLPDTYRRAVELRDIERLPYAEVASRLELNVNTVKSHVSRGRALLATMLEGAGG